MADNNVKYVSLDGLNAFYGKLKTELAKASGSVLPVGYAAAAGKATSDAANNNIQSTYISEIKFLGSGETGSAEALPTSDTAGAGQSVTINLSQYALKSEITAALHFKGVVATQAALPSSNVAVGDVYIVTTDNDGDSNSEFICTSIDPSITWEKLGPTKDFSGFITKKTSGVTTGNLVKFAADGDIADAEISASDLSSALSALGTGTIASGDDYTVTGGTVYTYLTTAANHQQNTIETVKVNGSALTPDANLAVDITVPVVAQSIADNETGYATGDQVFDYVASYVGNTANVTKVFDDSETPAHVDNLYEATATEIQALFV